MHYLILLLLHSAILQDVTGKTKYIIFINQSEALRPIPTNIESFWLDKIDFDTIIIQGEKIVGKLDTEIDQLEIVKSSSILYNTFSVNNAVIRYTDNIPIDTLYTDKFFHFWKINSSLYQDRKQYFKKRFAGL